MNRQMFNAMAAQYATPKVSGDGLVSWDGGKKCVIPSIELYGAAVQNALRGVNVLDISKSLISGIQAGAATSMWASIVFGNDVVVQMLKPGTTYTTKFKYVCTAVPEYDTKYSGYVGFLLYGKPGAIAIPMGQLPSTANVLSVGDTDVIQSTFTTPDDLSGIQIMGYTQRMIQEDGTGVNCSIKFTEWQIEEGNTATDYEPYCGGIPAPNPNYPIQPVCNNGVFRVADGGQAQAPELWGIPGTEYRDEWDPQTGRGIRRVKKLVLTPDLNWQVFYAGENGFNFAYISPVPKSENAIDGMFSHGKYDSVATANNINSACVYPNAIVRVRVGFEASVDDFKAFLQEQIDANTPVTIWYPLADPEPFTTAPAKLTMPTGYGQIIQVSGDVPDCPITARYLTHS